MGRGRALAISLLLLAGIAERVGALPELFDQLCASCHQDDSPTCAGCHNHRGELRGSATRGSYLPGETVEVTLEGGVKPGWIRGVLYDQEGTEIARATGPSGTGDDGVPADSVAFPVTFSATAPTEPGTYTWKAAYYGIFQFAELTHDEEWVPLTILVIDPDSTAHRTGWGQLKWQYRER